MKRETAVRVAVRTTSTEDGGDGDDGNDDNDDAEEWLEVGNVKSVDSQYTALAVARQRALIADVRTFCPKSCFFLNFFSREPIFSSPEPIF